MNLSTTLTRVLVVDDDNMLRREVVKALQQRGLDVFAAGRGDDGLALAQRHQPQVAVVDLGLPDGSGAEVIASLRDLVPQCAAVAFSVFDSAPIVLAALRAGALGYVVKSASVDALLDALKAAVNGEVTLSPSIARYVVDAAVGAVQQPEALRAIVLTEREQELLRLLAGHATYDECAAAMGIGLGTVQTHIKAIYRKLDVDSKVGAVLQGVAQGILPQSTIFRGKRGY
jgi:DNA-binding NarL/FixJ family response regulator